MNHHWKILSLMGLVLSLGLFAASCSAANPSATATSPAATASKMASATLTGTASPAPSSTPTIIPTHRTLSAPLFVHTPAEMGSGFLTAIAMPHYPQTSAHLKDWTEQDAVDLIREMDQYVSDSDSDRWGFASDRLTFINSQLAVRLAVQDALERFPDSRFKDDYLWELAFSRAALNEPGVDEWLIAHLDEALNLHGFSPETLTNLLGPHGFNANDLRPVDNLFGDGKTGWVFNVKTDKDSIHDGLFLAIRQKTSSTYQVFTLVSAWNFFSGYSYIEDVEDINKNGLPDVHVYVGRHSGNGCQGVSQLYEWNGSAFYDISKGVLALDGCETGGWTIGPDDKKGVPTFIVKHLFEKNNDQYTWNGKFYEFTGYFEATPFQTWDYRANDGPRISYANDVALLPALLDSPEALKRGPAYPDYLRFRLGVAYAAQSKPQQAIQQMQKLIDAPHDPSIAIYTTLAKKFLEVYKGNATFYAACAAAQQLDGQLGSKVGNESLRVYGITSELPDEWSGFMFWHDTFPCDQSAALAVLLKTLPANTKDIPVLLQKNGVKLAYSTSLDINGDGQMEWLVVDALSEWKDSHLIALQHGYFQAHHITNIGSAQIIEKVQVLRWKDVFNAALVLRRKDTLNVVSVSKDFEIDSLLNELGIKDYSASSEQSAPEIQLTYNDILPYDYFPHQPWDGYRWDDETQSFRRDLLEYKLFVQHNPKAAAEIAGQVLPLFDHWTKDTTMFYENAPHDYYLVGLSYELAGDAQKAAQIYWQLWHDYPESAYALMARAKLGQGLP